MAYFKIKSTTGEIIQADGFKFSHYVGKYRYWFGYEPCTRKITHIESGYKVTSVDITSLAAHLGKEKDAAKAALDLLIKTHGADKVKAKLDGAPKL